MEIVLVEPEIPQNTGNIARTCMATKTPLTLVRPLGFSLSTKQFRRAGMDYLQEAAITTVDCLEDYLEEQTRPFYFFSTKGKKLYSEIAFAEDGLLIFGSESKGLAPSIHQKYKEHFVTIPICASARSLNLSNAVAIALYEALRQQGYPL